MKKQFGNLTNEDFIIAPNIPLTIMEKENIVKHKDYLNIVSESIKAKVSVSKKSGHRPLAYELSKKRLGDSEHTTYNLLDRGAVDLIYNEKLLNELIKDKFYTRVCYYPNNGFIHADRKPFKTKGTRYYECQSLTGSWVLKRVDY